MANRHIVEMLAGNPKAGAKFVRGVERAVQRSYDQDLIRDGAGKVIATQHEIRRRTELCMEAAALLRREFQWSVDRIIDELPKMLRAKLDGEEWDPTTIKLRSTWASSSTH